MCEQLPDRYRHKEDLCVFLVSFFVSSCDSEVQTDPSSCSRTEAQRVNITFEPVHKSFLWGVTETQQRVLSVNWRRSSLFCLSLSTPFDHSVCFLSHTRRRLIRWEKMCQTNHRIREEKGDGLDPDPLRNWKWWFAGFDQVNKRFTGNKKYVCTNETFTTLDDPSEAFSSYREVSSAELKHFHFAFTNSNLFTNECSVRVTGNNCTFIRPHVLQFSEGNTYTWTQDCAKLWVFWNGFSFIYSSFVNNLICLWPLLYSFRAVIYGDDSSPWWEFHHIINMVTSFKPPVPNVPVSSHCSCVWPSAGTSRRIFWDFYI